MFVSTSRSPWRVSLSLVPSFHQSALAGLARALRLRSPAAALAVLGVLLLGGAGLASLRSGGTAATTLATPPLRAAPLTHPASAGGGGTASSAALAASAAALDAAAAAAVGAADSGPVLHQPLAASSSSAAHPPPRAAALDAAAASADPFTLSDHDRGPPLVMRGGGAADQATRAAPAAVDASLACVAGGVCTGASACQDPAGDPLSCLTSPSARHAAVAEAVRDTWAAYVAGAWGRDELRPLTGGGRDWVGLGLTLVDGLDTLLLARMRREFAAARAWVAASLDTAPDRTMSLFETTIRVVGGLLSAAVAAPALGGGGPFVPGPADPLLLARAADLALRLSPGLAPAGNGSLTVTPAELIAAWGADPAAFPGGTAPYATSNLLGLHAGGGAPLSDVNPATLDASPPAWTPHSSLAEATTLAVEYDFLARATGEEAPARAALAALRRVATAAARAGRAGSGPSDRSVPTPPHLPPMFLDPLTAAPASSVVTLGARGDSYFEYLLKAWLVRGKRAEDEWLRGAYVSSMRALRSSLLSRSAPSDPAAAASEGLSADQAAAGLLYVAELHAGRAVPKMDHLVCFLPGLLALGALHGLDTRRPGASPPDALDLDVARDLMATCYAMYRRTPTGLAPEIVHFNERGGGVAAAATAPRTAAAAKPAVSDDGRAAALAGATAAVESALAGNAVSLADAAAESRAADGRTAAAAGTATTAATTSQHHPSAGGGAFFIKPLDAHNLLRPEAVESMFVLWRVTRDPAYREMGWAAFRAFAKHAAVERPASEDEQRAGGGGGGDGSAALSATPPTRRSFAALDSVLSLPPAHRDVMDSFWLAETLKYLLLLFDDGPVGGGGSGVPGGAFSGEPFPLTAWVFNTEAHPLPIAGGPGDVAAARGYLKPPLPAGDTGAGAGGDEGAVALAAGRAAAAGGPPTDTAAVAAAAEGAAVAAAKTALRARAAAWAAFGTAAEARGSGGQAG